MLSMPGERRRGGRQGAERLARGEKKEGRSGREDRAAWSEMEARVNMHQGPQRSGGWRIEQGRVRDDKDNNEDGLRGEPVRKRKERAVPMTTFPTNKEGESVSVLNLRDLRYMASTEPLPRSVSARTR